MITIDEVKAHLRLNDTGEDAVLTAFVATAAAHVTNYIGIVYAEGAAPAPVKSAALLMVGDLYENREAQTDRPLSENRTFIQLLNPYRMLEA
jgi:uncharacterized phage protein (predicted DNA packaging)